MRFATDVLLHEMLLNVCAKWMLQPSTKSTWTCRTLFFGTCFFVPIVDSRLITKRATELLRPGRVNGVRIFLVFSKSASWIRLTGGTSCCDNQRWGNSFRPATSEEFIPWIESWSNHYWHCSLTWLHQLNNPGPSWANVSIFCGTDVDTIVLSSNVRLSSSVDFRPNASRYVDVSYVKRVAAHLFNRENSTFYGDDILYYFPQYVVESSGCVNTSKPSERNRRPNSTFQQ